MKRKLFPTRLGILLALAGAAALSAQTRQFLDAPVIKSDIPVQWDATGKSLQWLNHGQPIEFTPTTLFLSKGPINVTYPRMNPLKIRAAASATAVADPSVATIGKLVDAITSVVTTVVPPPPAAGQQAPSSLMRREGLLPPRTTQISTTCSDPNGDIGQLWNFLYTRLFTNSTLGDEVASWIQTIDTDLSTGPGDLAVSHAANLIGTDVDVVSKRISDITAAGAHIHDCATPDNANTIYKVTDVANSNNGILQQLTALRTAMTQLQTELTTTYAVATNWVGLDHRDYRLNAMAITPTLEQMQNVTVKIVSVDLKVDKATDGLTINKQDVTSVTFSIRRYSFLTPEIGTGAVFGTIKKPTYGTGKDAMGQTIITKTPDTSISVNPTVMVNFVCRCSAGALAPMLQMGAAASKDTPALLGGGGVRLFGLGKGDFAIGGGAMFSWVKDLQKLKPGDVVTGTSDINADLGFSGKPKLGGYFAILYQF